jgi:hypothetical protein
MSRDDAARRDRLETSFWYRPSRGNSASRQRRQGLCWISPLAGAPEGGMVGSNYSFKLSALEGLPTAQAAER